MGLCCQRLECRRGRPRDGPAVRSRLFVDYPVGRGVAAGTRPDRAPAGLFLRAQSSLDCSDHQAEVHSWYLVWALAATLVFLSIYRRLESELTSRAALSWSALWGFLCGIGLSHHLLSVLIIAPLAARSFSDCGRLVTTRSRSAL
jgi:hypothetical protein